MQYNLSDLKKKCVINVSDGRNMGKITDVIVGFPEGSFNAIIVGNKMKNFFSGDSFIVDVCCIEKIGDDTILVRLSKKNACHEENANDCD